MDEQLGPDNLRPTQKDCPDCGCCTTDLCTRGRTRVGGCSALTRKDLRETVAGCPCSAATAKGTAAWRAARVRTTQFAREWPLPDGAEALLRALAAEPSGDHADDPGGLIPQLRVRGLVRLVGDQPEITDLGRTYLHARDDVREVSAVRVAVVDARAGTALVEVPAWSAGHAVTVLLAQITSDTGLPVDELTDRWLMAEANPQAPDDDRLVLTHFHSTARPTAGFVGFTTEDESQ